MVRISLIFILLLSACNPLQKAQKLILNNQDASERIFRELEKTRPCANDTAFVTNLDTLVTTDTIINYKRDTINNVITLTEKGKTIYKNRDIIKIQTGYIVDVRRVNILMDSVRYYKTSLQDSTKTSKKWRGYFWGVIFGLIGYIAIKRLICRFQNI
jgi:hypothetical protein